MSEEVKEEIKEAKELPPKRIFARSAGIYDVFDGQNMALFIFNPTNSLEANLATIAYLKEEILKAIQNNDKQKEEPKTEQP